MKKIVIMSSHTWEDSMTSMQCAWGESFTFINITDPDNWSVSSASCRTGCGQCLKDVIGEYESIPPTDEHRAWFKEYRKAQHEKCIKHTAERMYEESTKEVEEYNKTKRIQRKGQIVVIHGGRKHDGRIGRVVWLGKNTYKPRYGSGCGSWRAAAVLGIIGMKPYSIPAKDDDLALIRPLTPTAWTDGCEKVYIDIDRCEVIEGFEPLKVTMEDCIRCAEHQHGAWDAYGKVDTYDHREY